MQNFIKTIISAVQTWTSKKIKDSTADWNQNDPNADNYVKNRTHWEEEAVIVTERVISGFSLMEEPLYAVENPFRMSPVVGSTYTVVWDGVSYDVKMQSFDGLGYIGNVNYVNMASGGNIPFAIVFAEDVFLVTESPAASHTISISGAVVHKLDSKYLDLPINLATTDDVQEAVDVANEAHNIANSKMKANNPVGTGSFSMNRKSGTTIGDFSHAEGRNTTASGDDSHAEGRNTTASGSNSHAEGYYTTASGSNSHAEGYYTTASENSSHAEGAITKASGFYSHAEGYDVIASGSYSHAEGNGTRTIGGSSHAEGRYNIPDTTDTYAHIVGNGESDKKRSNAHALDWDGNAWYAGDVYVGSTSGTNKDAGSKKLATEEYVDTALEDSSTSGGFVVQAEPPEDKNVLWVDTDDESEEVENPQGGGGSAEWNIICEGKIAEAVSAIVIDSSADGTPLEALDVDELLIYGSVKLSANSKIRFENNGRWVSGTYATTAGQFGAWVAPFRIRQQKTKNGIVTESSIESEHKVLCSSNGSDSYPIKSFEVHVETADVTFTTDGTMVNAYYR